MLLPFKGQQHFGTGNLVICFFPWKSHLSINSGSGTVESFFSSVLKQRNVWENVYWNVRNKYKGMFIMFESLISPFTICQRMCTVWVMIANHNL